jgi:GNAT superfamily N-acetyltransferase
VDPHDTSAYNAWYDAFSVAVNDDRPYAVLWSRDELRVGLVQDSAYWAKEIWALRDEAGKIVGTLFVELPLLDNTFRLSATIGVLREARRHGHGRTLSRLLEDRARHHGRTTLVAQLDVPIRPAPSTPSTPSAPSAPSAPTRADAISRVNPSNAPLAHEIPVGQRATSEVDPRNAQGVEAGEQTAGQAFATALGFSAANFEMHRVLELPFEPAVLEQLAAKAAERHDGYELRTWRDRCPDDLLDEFGALLSTFMLEAPQGELEVEAERWDAARIREAEQQSRARRRHSWTTVAIAPDGTLAGHTELHVGDDDPGKVFQSGTLVARAHRGHRLGLALKARNHLELQRVHDGPMVVHTWNGEENTAMNAVNAQLGFRPVERVEEWQRRD